MEGKHEAARAPRKNHRRSGAGMTALKVLGTLLAIGVCTALMFFGIFMKYVHTTLEPVLDVDMSAITLNQSSVIYYQDKSTGEWKELGRTEIVVNNLKCECIHSVTYSPVFVTRILLNYRFESIQRLRFLVYDADEDADVKTVGVSG